MQQRPSGHELTKKIKNAIEAVRQKRRDFVNISKVVGELEALDIMDSSEVWDLILILLEEVKPENYSGGRPPYRSYEKKIEGIELFSFTWHSQHLQQEMYIKFALDGDIYVYVSLHKSKPSK
jgi:hypothetical protein